MPRRHPPRDRYGRGPANRDDDRYDLTRAAESDQRQRANCAAKARYGSESEARSHALMHTHGVGATSKAYRCDWCDGWHLTRA
jgi:hypothetical protein